MLSSLAQWCCFLHLIKQDCLLKPFLKTVMLKTLPALSSQTNQKLLSISVTPKMVKKVIMSPKSSKVFQFLLQQFLSLQCYTLEFCTCRMYPEVFQAYHYLHNKWSWRDCNVTSSSILKSLRLDKISSGLTFFML